MPSAVLKWILLAAWQTGMFEKSLGQHAGHAALAPPGRGEARGGSTFPRNSISGSTPHGGADNGPGCLSFAQGTRVERFSRRFQAARLTRKATAPESGVSCGVTWGWASLLAVARTCLES